MLRASIIIPSKNEGNLIFDTVKSMKSEAVGLAHEIIVVDDASTDGSCDFLRRKRGKPRGVELITTVGIGSANARNMGAELATGDVLVFCDAHVTVEPYWLDGLVESLQISGVDAVAPAIATQEQQIPAVGYGMTWDHELKIKWLPKTAAITEIPIAPGGCVAVKKKAFEAVNGFERGFRVYGHEDAEFSLKLWLFGFGVYVNPQVTVRHYFRTTQPYPITMNQYAYNALRMAVSHFNSKRVAKMMNIYRNVPDLPEIIAEIFLDGDTLAQRNKYMQKRVRDDDWFMDKFTIPF